MQLPGNLAQQSSKAFLKTFENLYEHTPCFVEKSLPLVLADKKYNSLEKFQNNLPICIEKKNNKYEVLVSSVEMEKLQNEDDLISLFKERL